MRRATVVLALLLALAWCRPAAAQLDELLKQFPQHIAVRRAAAYHLMLEEAGFTVELSTYSLSPFPLVRHVERALAPLPFVGPTFRYRILIRARTP